MLHYTCSHVTNLIVTRILDQWFQTPAPECQCISRVGSTKRISSTKAKTPPFYPKSMSISRQILLLTSKWWVIWGGSDDWIKLMQLATFLLQRLMMTKEFLDLWWYKGVLLRAITQRGAGEVIVDIHCELHERSRTCVSNKQGCSNIITAPCGTGRVRFRWPDFFGVWFG